MCIDCYPDKVAIAPDEEEVAALVQVPQVSIASLLSAPIGTDDPGTIKIIIILFI